jgi:hypothetical protein
MGKYKVFCIQILEVALFTPQKKIATCTIPNKYN